MNTSSIGTYSTEILQSLGALSNNEAALARVAKYLRKVLKEQANDPSLMTEDEFFARIDEARKQPGKQFNNVNELDKYIRSL
ncbi:MAG: hypothetical protein J6T56_00395 [Bacteroidales bacterium]|nr:hypothetical protein [Bacteroidales bacterium]MBP5613710.1 hypothetical protein [Bacteroidales bacterium]